MKVTNLRCEYETNPLGIDALNPRLSWKLQDDRRGAAQSAYQVLVASSPELLAQGEADLWDSGEAKSDQTSWIEYAGKPLSSRQRAFWKVRVWDEQGNSTEYSEAAWWELGLLDKNEWTGEWIGSPLRGGTHSLVPCPYLRKGFEVEKTVVSARLYATALGLYEFSINGERVGNDVFTPGWTNYTKRVQYHVYDVTSLLQNGTNACGAVIGDGWYCGHVGWGGRQVYGTQPQLLAQIVLTFDDGSTQTVATDASWKYSVGPILESDFQMGEHYDARLELGDWNYPSYDDAAWDAVKVFDAPDIAITAHVGPPVRPQETLTPIEAPKLHDHKYIFDMGQNMVGRVRLKVSGEKGTTIRLCFAEILNKDGSIYTENLRTARATDYYTLNGEGEEIWEPLFTFHGFRYVEVFGLKEAPDTDMITGIVLNSDIARTGEWQSNDALLNQLQSNIWWGQKGNFLEVPTDCPQRDERLGWTGDAQVFVRTAAFNADVAGFFAKWQRDIREAQHKNGGVPAIVPDTAPLAETGGEVGGDSGPAWSDATVICPWTNYLVYGDKKIIADNYDVLVRYVQHLEDISRPHGLIRSHPAAKEWAGFGDWLSTDTPDVFGTTRKDLIGTAFFAYSTRLLGKIARALSKTEDAAKYESLFEEIKAAFNMRFVTPEGLVAGGTQTSYVLALHFDLLPQEKRAIAVDELVRDIKNRNNHLSVGFVGSPYIAQVLSDNGRLNVAYDLLHQTEHPSWLYAVTQGATTIWERWDGWTHDKGFQHPGMNSFNHYAYGAIGAWMYAKVAGIELDENEAAYKHIVFKPHLDPTRKLNQARAALDSIHGTIESDWKLDGATFTWKIVVPPNTHADVFVPTKDAQQITESGQTARESLQLVSQNDGYAQFQVGAGTYEFASMIA
jgi:alpha-L-rhamnosidase